MLVVSWPRSACVSNVLALGMLPHVCLSMFGGKLVCWVKTCLTCPRLCLARCSHVGTELLLLTSYVGSQLLPPVLCSATFGLLQCDLAPCSFLAMAAPVRHNNLKLGISEFRCVASPAPARAFVPARLSSVFGCLTRVARTSLFSDPITRSFIGGRVNHAQNLIPSALVEPTLAWKALRNPLFRLYSGQR